MLVLHASHLMDLHVVNRMVMNTVKVLLLVPSLGSELLEKKKRSFPY